MAPKKKRHCRAPNSKWRAGTGDAKMARTKQWLAGDAKRARASDRLEQFLYDHNVGWKDLHGLLVAYFKQELLYDTMETSALLRPSLGHRDRASSSSAEEVQDFMSWLPPEFSFPVAIASVCPSLGHRDQASSSSAEEVQDFMSWVPPELSFPAANQYFGVSPSTSCRGLRGCCRRVGRRHV